MRSLTIDQKLYYTLRLAAAMCFIGHGAFGIITKQIWCNYFGVFGIGKEMAYTLMPYVGTVDILMGDFYAGLSNPRYSRVAGGLGIGYCIYATIIGRAFAEFIERAGNYGAPFVLLLMQGGFKIGKKQWFARMDDNVSINADILAKVITWLRVFAFMLLIGHGWLNLIQKQGLLNQYHALGFADPAKTAQIVGLFEVLAALMVLIRPFKNILLVFIIWKISSELFYPKYEMFEWIERGGSYGVLLALWFAVKKAPAGSILWPFKKAPHLKVS